MKINNLNYSYTNLNNKKTSLPAKANNVSFGGAYGKAIDKIADPLSKWMVSISDSKPVKSMIKTFSQSKQGYTHMMTIESIVIGGFYMQNTARNKKIEKDQKLPLMINDGLVTAIAAVLNYTLDGKIANKIKQLQDSVKIHSMNNATKEMLDEASKILDSKQLTKVCLELNPFHLANGKDAVEEALTKVLDKDTLKKVMQTITPEKITTATSKTIKAKTMADVLTGIDLLKGLAIFSIIYRYLSPVIITPIANKISGKIQHSAKDKKAAAIEQKPAETVVKK